MSIVYWCDCVSLQVIVGGAQEEISLQTLMAEVEQDVMQEVQQDEAVSAEVISKKIHQKMKSRGNT